MKWLALILFLPSASLAQTASTPQAYPYPDEACYCVPKDEEPQNVFEQCVVDEDEAQAKYEAERSRYLQYLQCVRRQSKKIDKRCRKD